MREQRLRAAEAAVQLAKARGDKVIIEDSLGIMEYAMRYFFTEAVNAQGKKDADKAEIKTCLMDAVTVAKDVVNYRHPKLATVKVGADRENPLLVREGATSKQVMAELVAKIKATGLLPTNLKNMIDVTPQRMESQSG